MSHEDLGSSVEAKVMSGHLGRDKTCTPLASKVFFSSIKTKVTADSCEACQCVKVGSKFEKGGDKLKSIYVPLETSIGHRYHHQLA